MIKTIELAPYRRWFRTTLTIAILLVAGSMLLVWLQANPVLEPSSAKLIRNLLLYGPLCLAFAFTFYIRKQREIMMAIPDFESRKNFHQSLFRKRLYWCVISTTLACTLYWLLTHPFYLYVSLFEIVGVLLSFPHPFIFKRELQDPEIVFI